MPTQQICGPPAGFSPHDRKSPLTDPWEPLYSRRTDRAVVLGLWAGPAHTNSRGFVHGGLIGALADNAMGLSCARTSGHTGGLVTVSLNVDFLGTSLEGQWLEFDTVFVKPGRTLCFAQAFVTADGQPCARASAVFRVLGGDVEKDRRMSAYVVAQLSIHDRARYDRYAAGFLPTLKPFGGRLLAADEGPAVLEGDWPRDKLVLIAFPDTDAARAWAASPAYQAIAVDRLAGSEAVVLLAQGFTPA